jgi:hypothetical protein
MCASCERAWAAETALRASAEITSHSGARVGGQYVPHRVRIVARASPAGLGACSRMRTYFCANPRTVSGCEYSGSHDLEWAPGRTRGSQSHSHDGFKSSTARSPLSMRLAAQGAEWQAAVSDQQQIGPFLPRLGDASVCLEGRKPDSTNPSGPLRRSPAAHHA